MKSKYKIKDNLFDAPISESEQNAEKYESLLNSEREKNEQLLDSEKKKYKSLAFWGRILSGFLVLTLILGSFFTFSLLNVIKSY